MNIPVLELDDACSVPYVLLQWLKELYPFLLSPDLAIFSGRSWCPREWARSSICVQSLINWQALE